MKIVLYLFLTRSITIFIFTLLYILLKKVKRYSSSKFKNNLIFTLIFWEFLVFSTIVGTLTGTISKILIYILKKLYYRFIAIYGGIKNE